MLIEIYFFRYVKRMEKEFIGFYYKLLCNKFYVFYFMY